VELTARAPVAVGHNLERVESATAATGSALRQRVPGVKVGRAAKAARAVKPVVSVVKPVVAVVKPVVAVVKPVVAVAKPVVAVAKPVVAVAKPVVAVAKPVVSVVKPVVAVVNPAGVVRPVIGVESTAAVVVQRTSAVVAQTPTVLGRSASRVGSLPVAQRLPVVSRPVPLPAAVSASGVGAAGVTRAALQDNRVRPAGGPHPRPLPALPPDIPAVPPAATAGPGDGAWGGGADTAYLGRRSGARPPAEPGTGVDHWRLPTSWSRTPDARPD
jgi:hypothetical protein